MVEGRKKVEDRNYKYGRRNGETMSSEVKIKMSLCLTKYHAIKTYPGLNQAPCHEDMGE
jgi:hypothetical protein